VNRSAIRQRIGIVFQQFNLFPLEINEEGVVE
jgi:ABC-type polar amino acid transport system ATPase subunit